MEFKNRIYFAIVVLFFYIGDIIIIYFGLQNGGHGANIIMESIGFNGMIIINTLFLLIVLISVFYSEKHKKYEPELGVMIGPIIASGLFTVLNNIGFYR